jgi:uncharacterized protein (DUF2249 family)/quercetin dioxygenase-like cupin family protein
MHKYNLNELIEFDDKKFRRKVLLNESGNRMVLLSLRAGQSVPAHGNQGKVIIDGVRGHITLYEGTSSCELRAGEVVCLESGAPHRIEAQEDSVLFVVATENADALQNTSRELDLREVPRPERHPLVFANIDALTVGESFVLINDHDPVPLSRQIEDRRPGQVTWEYERREPGMFRIRITRIASPGAAVISA